MTERLRHFLFVAGSSTGDDGRWSESTTGILKG